MEEIKVGDYCRTKDGLIDKVIILAENFVFVKSQIEITEYGMTSALISINNITKYSKNIIDLIEVGDYVNGYRVEDVLESFVNIATGSNYFQAPSINEEDIKSIVTKEMFNQVKYEV